MSTPAVRSKTDTPSMPSQVGGHLTFFDKFATHANRFTSRPWFFAMCLLVVLIWAPSYFLIQDTNTWQLLINSATTIVTFLMVALLQNTQTRADNALQHKLNAIADGLADLMEVLARDEHRRDLTTDLKELRAAVGLEQRETA